MFRYIFNSEPFTLLIFLGGMIPFNIPPAPTPRRSKKISSGGFFFGVFLNTMQELILSRKQTLCLHSELQNLLTMVEY